MQVDKDRLYLLHARAYRESSLLVDFLSFSHGRISLVANTKGKKPVRSYLQPCRLLEVSYQLKSSLGKLQNIEPSVEGTYLPPISMFIYYQYIHELLLKLLPQQEPVEAVFRAYQQSLVLLCESAVHSALRNIELALIDLLIGLPDLSSFQRGGDKTQPSAFYLSIEAGLTTMKPAAKCIEVSIAQIEQLLLFEADKTNEVAAEKTQAITRFYIAHLLGGRPLTSRAVFKKLMKLVDE